MRKEGSQHLIDVAGLIKLSKAYNARLPLQAAWAVQQASCSLQQTGAARAPHALARPLIVYRPVVCVLQMTDEVKAALAKARDEQVCLGLAGLASARLATTLLTLGNDTSRGPLIINMLC